MLINTLRQKITEQKNKSGALAARRLERALIKEKTGIPAVKLDIIRADVKKTLIRHIPIDENEISVIIRMRPRTGNMGSFPVLEITVPIKEKGGL